MYFHAPLSKVGVNDLKKIRILNGQYSRFFKSLNINTKKLLEI